MESTFSTDLARTDLASTDIARTDLARTDRNGFGPVGRLFAPLVAILFTVATFSPVWADEPLSVVVPEQEPAASDSPSSPQNRFVLTRQGIIQEGLITDRDQSWYIQLPNQRGGITISKLDTACIADSREELFAWRRNGIQLDHVAEVIKLADWAQRNQLAREGMNLLGEAIQANRDLAVKEQLDHKLQEMQYVERIKQKAVARRQGQNPEDDEVDPLQREAAELENWVAHIPLSVQEKYFRKIQPILMKRCGSAECHHEDHESDRAFVLYRSMSQSSRRINNLRNLQAILQRVDTGNLYASPILSHPTVTDTRQKQVWPFGDDAMSRADYEAFRNWILGMPSSRGSLWGATASPARNTADDSAATGPSDHTPQDFFAATSPSDANGASSDEQTEPSVPPDGSPNESVTGPTRGPNGVTDIFAGQNPSPDAPDTTANRAESVPEGSAVPRDVYDPDVFNRQSKSP